MTPTPLDIATTGLDAPEPEILPCPFPHKVDGRLEAGRRLDDPNWAVSCWGCGAYGPHERTRAGAIAAWNAPTLLARHQHAQITALRARVEELEDRVTAAEGRLELHEMER